MWVNTICFPSPLEFSKLCLMAEAKAKIVTWPTVVLNVEKYWNDYITNGGGKEKVRFQYFIWGVKQLFWHNDTMIILLFFFLSVFPWRPPSLFAELNWRFLKIHLMYVNYASISWFKRKYERNNMVKKSIFLDFVFTN